MILVTCAIIINSSSEVLVTQRSAMMSLPHKWEFPGGKVEQGEKYEETIFREIKEELDIQISVNAPLLPVIHHYPNFSITLFPFICDYTGGVIKLAEHAQYLWLKPDNLLDLDWAEADIPVARQYLQTLKL